MAKTLKKCHFDHFRHFWHILPALLGHFAPLPQTGAEI